MLNLCKSERRSLWALNPLKTERSSQWALNLFKPERSKPQALNQSRKWERRSLCALNSRRQPERNLERSPPTEKKDTNALLTLASRARFCESAGNKIRGFVAEFELYLRMCARPVHHWGYFFMASLGAEEAEKIRRSHLADTIADYAKFKSNVEALFGKFEFEGSFRAQLRTHAQAGAETIAAYAARTTDVCSKAYPAFSTKTQLSLAVDHFIAGLADTTTRDNLLHDNACRSLSWQQVVQMAQACEASHLILHASAAAAATTSTKVAAPATSTSACTHDEITVTPA